MLRLARLEMDRLAPDFQRKSVGLPAFLLGGAALSGVASLFQQVLVAAARRMHQKPPNASATKTPATTSNSTRLCAAATSTC